MIEQSLDNMHIECIDVLLLKNIDDADSAAKVEKNIEVIEKFKKQGKVRFSGLSSHSPEYSIKALKTGLLDVAEVPFNYANRQFEAVLDLAAELDIGILAMKPFGGGRIFGEMGKGTRQTTITLTNALSFSMSHPSQPVLIPGIGTHQELDRYIEAIPNLKYLTDTEREKLTEEAMEFGDDFCRACGYCRNVCPEDLPVEKMLPLLDRAKHVRTDHTFKTAIKDKFQAIAPETNQCKKCGECLQECPYDLPIPERLKEAYDVLTDR